MRFRDKVALVTGAASGIGYATAMCLAWEGASLVLVDIDHDKLEEVKAEIQMLKRSATHIQADVADPSQVEHLIGTTLARFKRLDILVNNAGIAGMNVSVQDVPVEDWERVLAVNLRGVFLGCKYGAPALIAAGGGVIVNIASAVAGWDTFWGGGAYTASKAGIVGLTRTTALELAPYGIRVNAVCPGIIETPLSFGAEADEGPWRASRERFARRIPLGRVGQPEDVAAAVSFLASDDASYITGTTLLVDGGQTLQSWSYAPEGEEYPRH